MSLNFASTSEIEKTLKNKTLACSQSTRKLTSDTSKIRSEVRQKGRNHRKSSKTQADGAGPEPPSQPWPPAGAKQLTSGKSGIVTWSRSRGRPLALAALLRKLATELQLSWLAARGRNTTTGETETIQPRSKTFRKRKLGSHCNTLVSKM